MRKMFVRYKFKDGLDLHEVGASHVKLELLQSGAVHGSLAVVAPDPQTYGDVSGLDIMHRLEGIEIRFEGEVSDGE